jgi:uncharacterized protein
MKQTIRAAAFLALILFAQACNKTDVPQPANGNATTNGPSGKSLLEGEHSTTCNYIDGNWPASAYADGFMIDAPNTNFLNAHHAAIAGVWGQNVNNVPLYFAHGGPTFNAFSYSSPRKIIYGEDIYRDAVAQQGYSAAIYILAHEWGHQLQFTYGLPSVAGYANMELEADGYGGYYLNRPNSGYGGNWPAAALAVNYANTLGGGDHGTNAQRRSAVRLGWALGAYELNAQWFDYYFFVYFQSVLDGTFRTRPPQIRPDADPIIIAKINEKMDELRKIATNEISETDFVNLPNR